MVIRALVRARLLGIQLLTLEACVVVGTGNGSRTVAPALILFASWAGRLRLSIIGARTGVLRVGTRARARDRVACTGHGNARTQPTYGPRNHWMTNGQYCRGWGGHLTGALPASGSGELAL
jgi:hypothetical protein